MSINRACIGGGLTRDAELRANQNGTPILTFTVAVSDRRKDPQTGEWKDYPNYIDCVLFGKRAESISKYMKKGTRVTVEGKLRWSQWERDGQKRSKIEVVVDDVEFYSRQKGPEGDSVASDGNGGSGGPYGSYEPQHGYQGGSGDQGLYDEDLPF